MNKAQKQYKALIKADLKIASDYCDSSDKSLRLQAAYHAQQAVEKTIKLKAEIEGLNLWGHDIDVLIKKCEDSNIEINIPAYIRNKADQITGWEAECRYYPVKIVRKDSIKRVCDEVKLWLDQGKTR